MTHRKVVRDLNAAYEANPAWFNRSLRCVEGRLMRHDPQHDDPYLETDVGECRACDGRGCDEQEQD